jgi:DNA-binding transcriptional regulator YdaS (Cro superfamily)
MNPTPIQLAIQIVGSQKVLAEALGVEPSLVSQWVTGRRPVAAHHCAAIELACGGGVQRAELRPDVFGYPKTTKHSMSESAGAVRKKAA